MSVEKKAFLNFVLILSQSALGSGRGELEVCCCLGCVNGKRYFLLSS